MTQQKECVQPLSLAFNDERGERKNSNSFARAFNAISEMENRTNRIQFPSKWTDWIEW
jgi:hypothetical protein